MGQDGKKLAREGKAWGTRAKEWMKILPSFMACLAYIQNPLEGPLVSLVQRGKVA